ncbi:MAG: bifunctional 4-hydroxy-2-oxoglutarate aldolase/2-dehydro-3-deoxy-phosphogluconate aldolase [Clostridiales bacterium]|nr:bifunctional 4-hydroxy-2-oxoglutarate aldolase/2-dehydro-3-deoxy-phosphogluconate aldolase [Clostridiales bacterium]
MDFSKQDIMEKMGRAGIVPVVVIENAEDAVPTAQALLAGGITFMEITFRTACAAEAIRAVSKEVPDMIVGAGTVLSVRQAEEAVEAGADFIVSPGLDEETVIWCQERGIPVCPGCVTPTEIMAAVKLGLSVIKFFPANVYGGMKAIKALSAVFGGVKFLPTGGVNSENLSEFAKENCIFAIGGSWVCTKKDIREHQFERITKLSREAVEIIREARA